MIRHILINHFLERNSFNAAMTDNTTGAVEVDPLLSEQGTTSHSYDVPTTTASTKMSDHYDQGNNKISRISYSPRSHVQVLFTMHGSVLPQVLPFCVSNVLWTLIVEGCRQKGWFDLTFKSIVGHSFMGILVSFLVVTRSRISYQRYMDSRRHLGEAYLACRELIHFACFYTLDDTSALAQAWRQEVAYRTIVLLRVTMDVLYWTATKKKLWETMGNFKGKHQKSKHIRQLREYEHGARTQIDEVLRAPLILIYNVREIIMEHTAHLGHKMPVNEYRDLVHQASAFNKAYHGFRDLVFTPYPFPLAQVSHPFTVSSILKRKRVSSKLLI